MQTFEYRVAVNLFVLCHPLMAGNDKHEVTFRVRFCTFAPQQVAHIQPTDAWSYSLLTLGHSRSPNIL